MANPYDFTGLLSPRQPMNMVGGIDPLQGQSLMGQPVRMPAPSPMGMQLQQRMQPQQRGLFGRIGSGISGAARGLGSGLGGAARGLGGAFTGEGSSARLSALGASLLQGPSRTPISLGSSLAQGLLAGNIAAQQEEQMKLQRGLLQAQTASEFSKAKGLFSGTGTQAQAANVIRELAPYIKAGTANESQIADYKLAEAMLSKEVVREYTDPETGVTTRSVESGLNMEQLGFPQFVKPRELGSKQPTYTEGQYKSGKFASNMYLAEQTLSALETAAGYDPSNPQDYWARVAPMGFEGYFRTDAGRKYERAKEGFITAVLRDESGAAIGTEEYKRKERELFPLPSDKPADIEMKRKARRNAFESMVKSSGKYFERTYPKKTIESLKKMGGESNPIRFSGTIAQAESQFPAGTHLIDVNPLTEEERPAVVE